MEDHCAPTLEALEEFLQRQKDLLSKTQSDVERLRELRQQVADDPQDFVKDFPGRLNDRAFRISERSDCFLQFSKPIQWAAFQGVDPTPLQHLKTSLLASVTDRARPRPTQRSQLSALQTLVKTARKSIVDPILQDLAPFADLDDDSSSLTKYPPFTVDAFFNLAPAAGAAGTGAAKQAKMDEKTYLEEMKRYREHEKIRELKKRRVRGWGGLTTTSTAMTAAASEDAVFIVRDVDDESAEVDIDMMDVSSALPPRPRVGKTVVGPHHGGKGAAAFLGGKGQWAGKGKHVVVGGKSPAVVDFAAEDDDGGSGSALPPLPSMDVDNAEDDDDGDIDLELAAELGMDVVSIAQHSNRSSSRSFTDPFEDYNIPPPPSPDIGMTTTTTTTTTTMSGRSRRASKAPVSYALKPPKVKKSKAVAAAPTTAKTKAKAPKRKHDDDEEWGGGGGGAGNDDNDDLGLGEINGKGDAGGGGKKKSNGKQKAKPETYKLAWSDEEQRLLEDLLEQIPDGEKFRWQKISRAMGGRRTPRQVASRVQKYFEKLKRFGVGL